MELTEDRHQLFSSRLTLLWARHADDWAAERNGELIIFTQLHVIKVGTPGTAGGTSANSLTVVVTQCQAEIITWFLTYAALKYSLESYQDYSPGSQAPDPNCKTVEDAHGVTLTFIQAHYPSLF